MQAYVDNIAPESRALFDRVHRLVLEVHPEATVALSYKMPSYRVGKRRIYVGAWRHGISMYGFGQDRDGGFSARHPEMLSGRATLRLRTRDAGAIPDNELRDLIRAALAP
ncbi:MAG TPA: DUF1801 domain-containing protein [Actinomycetota bacterium]|nr:DUF1801 domain-containing protein [Actinomycetota bacterium]